MGHGSSGVARTHTTYSFSQLHCIDARPRSPCCPDDAVAVTNLHIASWLAHYRGILPDELLDNIDYEKRLAHRTEQFANPVEGITHWVVEDEGTVVGWASAGPAHYKTREDNDDLPPRTAELYAIYLDPTKVGKGYGRRLMGAVLRAAQASGAPEIVVWHLTENDLARRFYEKAGFVRDERMEPLPHMGAMKVRQRRPL